MAMQLNLKPTHKAVKAYYDALNQLTLVHATEEGAVRSAFQSLLGTCAGQLRWTLRPEYPIRRRNQAPLRVDAALFDDSHLIRGMWEAKDEHDDLEKEVRKKLSLGYPDNNILFQAPTQAILVQRGAIRHKEDISQPEALVHVVRNLFEYRTPEIERWEDAVARFKQEVPEQARALKELIDREHAKNSAFREAFAGFVETCRTSLNPNLADEAVERMLIQHILTERIFTKLFDNDEFRSRNVVAAEIEKVVAALIKGSFNRTEFLSSLEPFYRAIELSAKTTESYEEKQGFLNTVYGKFFQSFSPKEADTLGIVYTPQEIVDFMVRSVEDILKKEFGKSLADRGVHILDPFVGTGNFVTRVMREIAGKRKSALAYKYEHELHCNEVMLLPYYIASMNIEHEYLAQTGQYEPFPGICLVDTFELAEPEQASLAFMNEENTARVRRQKEAPIFVIVGNPPYNANQQNENDNNKNRKYKYLDQRVRETYRRDSKATNTNTLSDPFVKAFRWATDRLGTEGIVAFVTNNALIQATAADGLRYHLAKEFDSIYILDLTGDVRQNPKISGTKHNVFGIQVGVSITFLARNSGHRERGNIFVARAGEFWTKAQKFSWLDTAVHRGGIEWTRVEPDKNNTWMIQASTADFRKLTPMVHSPDLSFTGSIFETYSNGAQTNRDAWLYGFDREKVSKNVHTLLETYTAELARWNARGREVPLDSFLRYDDHRIKWCSRLKQLFAENTSIRFNAKHFCQSRYRPFTTEWLYFDPRLVHRPGKMARVFCPDVDNVAIATTCHSQVPFSAQALGKVPALDVGGRPSQCFPFYTYDEDGSNRRENITDWALDEFRKHYRDQKITKWDIFHYTYAVLHHPEYRERYAANLKRELPRIPFAGARSSTAVILNEDRAEGARSESKAPYVARAVSSHRGPSTTPPTSGGSARDDSHCFWAFVKAGRTLAELHVNYEKQPEYPLERIENPNQFPDYRVDKMRLGKDKTSLVYNGFLTLSGIPPEVYEYRLGNRSALEWVVDQYQVSTDKRSGIKNDPNREDDPEYIVRLIGQVVYVSLETVKIVKALPPLGIESGTATHA